jgi:hypothetical protein
MIGLWASARDIPIRVHSPLVSSGRCSVGFLALAEVDLGLFDRRWRVAQSEEGVLILRMFCTVRASYMRGLAWKRDGDMITYDASR